MIRLVGGLPGSGKSYYAANFISKFGEYDNLYKNFVITKDIQVFTNLDDLQIQHSTLDGCYERCGGPENFFTVEHFTKIRELWPKSHILIIIDEAQRIIDDSLLKLKEVAFFFQYHRHLGIDIFLLTNDIASCSKKVVNLCEFVIEAQPRSKGLPGVFRYKFRDTKGTHLYSETVRLKNEVFSIYKSFTTDESAKPKNVIMHWIMMLAVVLFFCVVGYKFFVNRFLHRHDKPKPAASFVTSSQAQTAPPLPPAVPVAPPASTPAVPALPLTQVAMNTPESTYQMYHADGYIVDNGKTIIQVNGVTVRLPSPYVQKYYRSSGMVMADVNFFGVPRQKTQSYNQSVATAEPVSKYDPPSQIVGVQQYTPIPAGTDIKQQFIKSN